MIYVFLYNQRRATSLSFKSTSGQRNVNAQPSSSFVAIITPNRTSLHFIL